MFVPCYGKAAEADEAQSLANSALTTANSAQSNANSALTTANSAQSNANSALSTANSIAEILTDSIGDASYFLPYDLAFARYVPTTFTIAVDDTTHTVTEVTYPDQAEFFFLSRPLGQIALLGFDTSSLSSSTFSQRVFAILMPNGYIKLIPRGGGERITPGGVFLAVLSHIASNATALYYPYSNPSYEFVFTSAS